MTQINAFFSSVFRRIIDSAGLDTKRLAEELGYINDHFVRMWRDGSNLPRLDRLADIANAVGLPHEDLLLAWLCDNDPRHRVRYEIIAAQLMGEEAAKDLLSGCDENSDRPWWSIAGKPVAGAAVAASRDDAPPGRYRDW